MSQSFSSKYDFMRSGNPSSHDQSESMASINDTHYETPSHTRHLCFVWNDGRKLFLSYNYLIAGEYTLEPEKITLTFTSHFAILEGINLESVFYELMQQRPKVIACCDSRYNVLEDTKPLINSITCEANK